MSGTFEETIGQELDALYRAALFFCGGQAERAERILTSAILSTFLSWRSSGGATPAVEGVERRLARGILNEARRTEGGRAWRRQPSRADDPGASRAGTGPMGPDVEELMRSALDLEARARIAFWYAVLERRSYAGVGGILGCSPREVAQLVREGQRSMHEALGSSHFPRGTTGGERASGTGSGHGLP